MKDKIKKLVFQMKQVLRKVEWLKLYQFYFFHIQNGKKIYNKLVCQYGPEYRIYVNHYPGTGDVYITSALLNAWVKKKHVEKYVVTVIGKSAYNVVKMFQINDVVILSSRETEDLLHYLQTIGETNPNIEVLHFTPDGFNQTLMMRFLMGENGNNFLNMYLSATFPGLTVTDMCLPVYDSSDQEIDNIFFEKGLIPGKTVVLVPYANTIDLLSDGFWNFLADTLLKKGYTVCTNCNYPKQKKILGTTPIFLPYNQMLKFINKAGAIIQLRSGLTDLLYTCTCKNYVLYPTENSYRFGSETIYEYFSLEKMGLTDKAIELKFSRKNEYDIYERIVSDF